MGFFKKDGADVIDFTLLQKKGLLRDSDVDNSSSNEVLDLTKINTNSGISNSTAGDVGNPFDMLSSLASVSSSTGPTYPSSNSYPNSDNSDMQNLRVKLDDLEYKFERLMEKIGKLEDELREKQQN